LGNGLARRMKRLSVAYDRFDVVIVPFPFMDRQSDKRRPALVVSDSVNFGHNSGHCVLAMITSSRQSPWQLDVPIGGLEAAGLPSSSKIRMKLFTMDHRLILRKVGHLSPEDQANVNSALVRLAG